MKKYKIYSSMKNKNLVGDIVQVKKIKSKGGRGDGGRKLPKPKAPAWFADFRNEVMQRFDSQDKRFDKLEKEVSSLRSDIKNLENRLDNIIKLNNLKE